MLSSARLERDSTAWAYACASTALGALVRIDRIDITFRNSTHWAFVDASTACYAFVRNFVSHTSNFNGLNNSWTIHSRGWNMNPNAKVVYFFELRKYLAEKSCVGREKAVPLWSTSIKITQKATLNETNFLSDSLARDGGADVGADAPELG